MNAFVIALCCFIFFFICYRYYSTHLAKKIFELDPNRITPAHEFEDGFDFIPGNKYIVLGHHYTSIAGAAPVVGPAIAIIWGWVPAILWVTIGSPLIGAVHDFGTMVASLRNKGKNIGDLVEIIVGPQAKMPFLLVAWACLWLILASFALVIASLFNTYPQVVIPVWSQIVFAVIFGFCVYKYKMPIVPLSIIGLICVYAVILVGLKYPLVAPPILGSPLVTWCIVLCIYCYVATSLPVWVLLQSRDYLNALLLCTALIAAFIGMVVLQPKMVAPPFNFVPDAPPVLPFLFITIACGASAGLHGLIATGTTSKQVDKEPDAQLIGYAGMLGEGVLSIIAICACGAGFASRAAWDIHYSSWAAADPMAVKVAGFVNGMGTFFNALGIPVEFGVALAATVMICFAATTLDTATRIQRMFTVSIFQTLKIRFLTKLHPATIFAVGTAFAIMMVDGGGGPGTGGLILWPLFGNSNQLMAATGMTFLCVFLATMVKPLFYTLIPALVLLIACMWALVMQMIGLLNSGQWLLFFLALVLGVLQIWVITVALGALRRLSREKGLIFGYRLRDKVEDKGIPAK